MVCSEVRERLVPWRDGELGRSEQALVEAHVLSCPRCAALDRALVRSVPRPGAPAVPDAVRARLADALDPDRILALAERPEPRQPGLARAWVAARAQLSRPAPVSRGAALLYLVLLAGTFGWGLSSWWSRPGDPAPPTAAGTRIPAAEFRPAAYEPGREPSDDAPRDR